MAPLPAEITFDSQLKTFTVEKCSAASASTDPTCAQIWTDTTYRLVIVASTDNGAPNSEVQFDVTIFNDCTADTITMVEIEDFTINGYENLPDTPVTAQYFQANPACPVTCAISYVSGDTEEFYQGFESGEFLFNAPSRAFDEQSATYNIQCTSTESGQADSQEFTVNVQDYCRTAALNLPVGDVTKTYPLWTVNFVTFDPMTSDIECGAIEYFIDNAPTPPFTIEIPDQFQVKLKTEGTLVSQVQQYIFTIRACITIQDGSKKCDTSGTMDITLTNPCIDTVPFVQETPRVMAAPQLGQDSVELTKWEFSDSVDFDTQEYGTGKCGAKEIVPQLFTTSGDPIDFIQWNPSTKELVMQPSLATTIQEYAVRYTVRMLTPEYANTNSQEFLAIVNPCVTTISYTGGVIADR